MLLCRDAKGEWEAGKVAPGRAPSAAGPGLPGSAKLLGTGLPSGLAAAVGAHVALWLGALVPAAPSKTDEVDASCVPSGLRCTAAITVQAQAMHGNVRVYIMRMDVPRCAPRRVLDTHQLQSP